MGAESSHLRNLWTQLYLCVYMVKVNVCMYVQVHDCRLLLTCTTYIIVHVHMYVRVHCKSNVYLQLYKIMHAKMCSLLCNNKIIHVTSGYITLSVDRPA